MKRRGRRFSDFVGITSQIQFWLIVPELSIKRSLRCRENQLLTDVLKPHLFDLSMISCAIEVTINDQPVSDIQRIFVTHLHEGCKVSVTERDSAGNFSNFKGSRKSEKRNSTSGDQMEKLSETLANYSNGGLPDLPPDIKIYLTDVTNEDLELESDWTSVVNDHGCLQNSILKQQAAVWELLQTEVNFINHLRSIFTVYVSVFCEIHKVYIPEITPYNIFSNLHEVCGANGRFWLDHLSKPLHQSRKTNEPLDPSLLKEGFINIRNILKPYTKFCQEVAKCRAFIQKQEKENQYFAAYLQWASGINNSSTRLSLCDLLAIPFQRLTKYRLILDNIRKYSQDPSIIRDMDEMISSVQHFVREVDDDVMRSDRERQLDELDAKIDSYEVSELTEEVTKCCVIEKYCQFKLNSKMMNLRDEKYVRERLYSSPLKMKESGQGKCIDVQCYLFTDLFLITKSLGKKHQDKLKIIRPPIRLDKLVLRRISESSFLIIVLNDFQLLTNYYIFTIDNKKSAEAWFTLIKEAQKTYKRLCHQDSIHSDISTGSYSSNPSLVFTGSSPNLSQISLNALSSKGCLEFNPPSNGAHFCCEPPRVLDKRQRAMTFTEESSPIQESKQFNYASLKISPLRKSGAYRGSVENIYSSVPSRKFESPCRDDRNESPLKVKHPSLGESCTMPFANAEAGLNLNQSSPRHYSSESVSRRKFAPIEKKRSRTSCTTFQDFNHKVTSKSFECHPSQQRKPTPPPIISICSVTDDEGLSSVEYINFNEDGMPQSQLTRSFDQLIQKTELPNVTESLFDEPQLSNLNLETYDSSPIIGRHLHRQRRSRTEPVVESTLAGSSQNERDHGDATNAITSGGLIKRNSYPASKTSASEQLNERKLSDGRQNSSSGVSSLSSLQLNISGSSSSNTINSASTDSIKTVKATSPIEYSTSMTQNQNLLPLADNDYQNPNPEETAHAESLFNRVSDANERRLKFHEDRKQPQFSPLAVNEESSPILSRSPNLIRRLSKSLSDIRGNPNPPHQDSPQTEFGLSILGRNEADEFLSISSSRHLSDASQETTNSELMVSSSISDVNSVTMV